MNHLSFSFLVLLLLGAGCFQGISIPPTPSLEPGPVACTMEAKQCPDGSYVSRTGPKCEFSACPNPPPEPVPPLSPINKTCHGPGDAGCGLGYQCIQDCGPPVIRVDEPPPSYHCQTDAFAKKPRMCPICLASNTFVATPNGDVKVTDLKIGMPVWSLNAHGKKVPRTIIKVSQTPVSASHKVVHLILSDGREVWVSPNHPILNGHPIMSLHTGDIYDGAKIVSTDLVPYWDTATYDLLPDGDTDAYWANGILLESTLR